MNYTQFKAYLLRFLWREGDTVLDADLDNIILMGHSRLNSDLRVEEMSLTQSATLQAESIPVPSGYLETRSLYTPNRQATPLEYVSPHELFMQRVKTNSQRFLPIYSHTGGTLEFCGPMSVENPETLTMTYYREVPDFATDDTSWLESKYLDLYTYACLMHTATYLRDDERLAVWQALYATTLESVLNSAVRRKYAGSPLKPSLPGIVR